MNSKHALGSKINVTAILIGVIAVASLANKLPPQLAHLAPWFTLAGAIATVLFRTCYTGAHPLRVSGKPPLAPSLAIAGAIAALLAGCAPATLPRHAMSLQLHPGACFRVVLWLAVAYVITSAYEHFGHRLMMHGRVRGLVEYFDKHCLHHARFAPFRKYRTGDDPAGEWVGIDLGAPMMFFASSIIWLPVAFFSRTGAIVLAVFFSLHGEAWSWFHREIHYPRGRWFARTAYFRFVLRYHGRHHERQGVNFTVMCPLMDQVMGTFGGLLPTEHTSAA